MDIFLIYPDDDFYPATFFLLCLHKTDIICSGDNAKELIFEAFEDRVIDIYNPLEWFSQMCDIGNSSWRICKVCQVKCKRETFHDWSLQTQNYNSVFQFIKPQQVILQVVEEQRVFNYNEFENLNMHIN